MQAKSERIELRMDEEQLNRVDRWRTDFRTAMPRSEAVRRLLEIGLSTTGSEGVRVEGGELLIIMMLRDLYKHLGVKGEIDPDFVAEALWGGHTWGFEWRYPGLFHETRDNIAVRDYVLDVLEMWDWLELSYKKLSDADKQAVADQAKPFGKDVVFPGFDGNNESECIAITRFLTNHLDRFTTFSNRYLNSHHPTTDIYNRMLSKFGPMKRTLAGGSLSVNQIVELLKAQIHPDNQRE